MSSIRLLWVLTLGCALVVGSGRCLAAERAPAKPGGPSPAAELVQQALDNEVAGDGKRRAALLQEAIEEDADYPAARWHAGEIRVNKTWRPYDAVVRDATSDPFLNEYRVRRRTIGSDPSEELKLARWCRDQGLADQARCHFARVLVDERTTPKMQTEAAGRLNLVSFQGMLLTRREAQEAQEQQRRIENEVEIWRPRMEKWRDAINGPSAENRQRAAAAMREQDYPPEAHAAWLSFLPDCDGPFAEEVVSLLTTLDGPDSTAVLAAFAVFASDKSVRQRATSALSQRRREDYCPALMNWLVAPMQIRTEAARGKDGLLHARVIVDREGAAEHRVWVHQQSYAPMLFYSVMLRRVWGQWDWFAAPRDPLARLAQRGLIELSPRVRNDLEANRQARVSAQQEAVLAPTRALEEALAQANVEIAAHNERVFDVLEGTTRVIQQRSPTAWWDWWQKYNEVQTPATKPTVTYHDFRYRYEKIQQLSCFAAGTIVWTESGLVNIESVQPGDRVLAQDQDTGELALKAVLATTLRPPANASALLVNGESITTTLGHPLWLTGKGWEMAKHVQAGDQLHGIHGIVNVNAVEPLPEKVQAYNLVVDDFATYFVGNCGMLVHDNTYRKPTRAVLPGLVP